MVKNHGYRVKTRSVYRKKVRERGIKSLSRFLVDYEIGDKVDIIGDPAFQKRGLPHKRFHGKTGQIIGKRGRCYEVKVKDLNKEKMIIVGKAHLRKNKFHEQ
ncbi:MAG: 50S ribosomal protein L21e [Candidatus Lokiarchaeota archaeon]|nr:50S ribosomal protein L21e [Candidatus Lokiarchaeota archaeon]